MSDFIQIDTVAVKEIAVSIRQINEEINTEFLGLSDSVNNLRNVWKGDGGSASYVAEGAIKVFSQITQVCSDNVYGDLEEKV